MTDRARALIVVLDEDIRVDDAKRLIAAVEQLRGVLTVKPFITQPGHIIAESRAKNDVIGRLLKLVDEMQNEMRGVR